MDTINNETNNSNVSQPNAEIDPNCRFAQIMRTSQLERRLFSNVIYTLPNGRYRAKITAVDATTPSKWIIDFKIYPDGTIFRYWVTFPLNRSFGLGKTLYNMLDEIGYNFTPKDMVGDEVIIDIFNRTTEERTYSNITGFSFICEDEEEDD